jgi:4-hydroxy-tetrahydrodipicolinate reductase
LQRFGQLAAKHFPDVEIIELHHEQKLDAPSGTAVHTARLLAAARGQPPVRPTEQVSAPGCRGAAIDGVPVHSVRLPGLLAHQEVLFGGPGQLLSLRHDTTDRRAFMPGVLLAVRRAPTLDRLVVGLEHLMS